MATSHSISTIALFTVQKGRWVGGLAFNLASGDNLCPSQTGIHLIWMCLASNVCWGSSI